MELGAHSGGRIGRYKVQKSMMASCELAIILDAV
jgi:hypothetical protein